MRGIIYKISSRQISSLLMKMKAEEIIPYLNRTLGLKGTIVRLETF